uniref:Uncharacterized protein n=1 Tax=Anguilla anguilla TaxID=7936 RepID=A0A0E9PUF3_ANGAN
MNLTCQCCQGNHTLQLKSQIPLHMKR